MDSTNYYDGVGLTPSLIEALRNQGLNDSEIAVKRGVTKQAVSDMAKRYGLRRTKRQVIGDSFPIQARGEHVQSAVYKMLRNHGEYIATGGAGMKEYKLDRLRSWYRKLRDENLVVEYDPEIPPKPGVSKQGGFTYRERLPEDGKLLIRVNEHTNLTELGQDIWTLPDTLPK